MVSCDFDQLFWNGAPRTPPAASPPGRRWVPNDGLARDYLDWIQRWRTAGANDDWDDERRRWRSLLPIRRTALIIVPATSSSRSRFIA
jgi:hypothetical protein